jgi:GMP synthase (glutamine-hydrolysing)
MKVFQWHGDIFKLPNSAMLLASSDLYPQAFRLGNSIGILFHLEVTSQMIHNRTQNYAHEMNEAGISADVILDVKILNLRFWPIVVRLCSQISPK